MGNVKTVVDDEVMHTSTKQTGRAGAQTAAGTHFDAGLSAEDKARVEAYSRMYSDAKERGDSAAMAAAHEAAERVRAGYGYSGGADGSEYIPLQQERELSVPEFTAGTQVEDYSDYLTQMYTAKKQAALAELKSAYDNSMAGLDRAEAGLAEGYRAARSEAAGAHEQERRNFAQFAAANGLNNGAAGQAELARGVALQNNMNTIRTAQADAVADLALQRAEAETEYNAAIAQAQYTGEYELAAALYEEKVRVQEALTEQEIRRQQYALEQYQLQYQAQRDAVADRQYERGQALKEKTQADELELAWAELSQEEKLALAELALAQKKQEDAAALDWAAQDLAQQKYDDAKADAARKQAADDSVWVLPAGVYEALEQGEPEKAAARIDAIWDTLTTEQREKTKEILAGYGFRYQP